MLYYCKVVIDNIGILMLKFLRSPIYFLLIIFTLVSCKPHAYISKVDTAVIALDTNNPAKEDTAALRLIKPFKEQMDARMNGTIAYSSVAMSRKLPEGLLNDFVADLVLKISNDLYKPADNKKIEICLLNYGSFRAPLPKGKITLKNIYELMPFENALVVVTLSGEKMKEMFDYIAKVGGDPLSGITMGLKDTIPDNILINGKPFDVNKNYKVVTSDYTANGGDKMNFFKTPLNREDVGIKLRDAIIMYVTEETSKGDTLKEVLDKRVYDEK
jgi:2',3'-cyclic-nucleotide 2'-phosphodiesterase (5'-nucleotidase family)